MKKLNLAIALAVGLAVPLGAQATEDDELPIEEEVTIRVMEMHENSSESVMNRINLPEAALEKVTEEANYRHRYLKREKQAEDPADNGSDNEAARERQNEAAQHQDGRDSGNDES